MSKLIAETDSRGSGATSVATLIESKEKVLRRKYICT
jgi:hypothetical protein